MSDGWTPGMVRDLNANLSRLGRVMADACTNIKALTEAIKTEDEKPEQPPAPDKVALCEASGPLEASNDNISPLRKVGMWEMVDGGPNWERNLSNEIWFTCWQVEDPHHTDVHNTWAACVHIAIKEGDSDLELWWVYSKPTRQDAQRAIEMTFIEHVRGMMVMANALMVDLTRG